MSTLVFNQSTCSQCGRPSGHCTCRDANDYLPLPTMNLRPDLEYERVRDENAARLAKRSSEPKLDEFLSEDMRRSEEARLRMAQLLGRAAYAENSDYLPLPTMNLGKTVWEQDREFEEEVRKENYRRLTAISSDPGSVDSPLPLPTINWKQWAEAGKGRLAAKIDAIMNGPCDGCPDDDILPLPKL